MAELEIRPPFASWSGPRDARIVLVGEAWGEAEETTKRPFAGPSGKLLFEFLGQAMPEVAPELHAEIEAMFKYDLAWVRRRDEWLAAASIAMTNVFARRPIANDLGQFCSPRNELGKGYALPPISRAKYLSPQYLPEVYRLYEELGSVRPNLIVALGNTACWALLSATNIGSIRGNATTCHLLPDSNGRVEVKDWKVIPTYHPAAVLRQWSWRPIVVADLMKAAREGCFAELVRPKRRALFNPTISEVEAWTATLIAKRCDLLSCDIETGAGQIKCISFAPSHSEAICIPFVDLAMPCGSYWPSARDELRAWACVRALLESGIPILGQNFLYDLQYIMPMGVLPTALAEDTMLLHHSMFPELQKGLGFLGSVYTNEASWKLMNRPRADTEKRDE